MSSFVFLNMLIKLLTQRWTIPVLLSCFTVLGCNSSFDPAQSTGIRGPGKILGQFEKGNSGQSGSSQSFGNFGTFGPGKAESLPMLGDSCKSSDPGSSCLGLKYVVYENSKGKAVISPDEAVANVRAINELWKPCQIAFQIDEYLSVDPSSVDLEFNTAEASELYDIRSTFGDDSHILVVTTGRWDRSGSLGDTGANAWTNMPGEGLYGAILESAVAGYSNIYAHELAHYLNLLHESDSDNLMNPIIYDDSIALTSEQCRIAHDAISRYWGNMLR